jgi:hypothetical protein
MAPIILYTAAMNSLEMLLGSRFGYVGDVRNPYHQGTCVAYDVLKSAASGKPHYCALERVTSIQAEHYPEGEVFDSTSFESSSIIFLFGKYIILHDIDNPVEVTGLLPYRHITYDGVNIVLFQDFTLDKEDKDVLAQDLARYPPSFLVLKKVRTERWESLAAQAVRVSHHPNVINLRHNVVLDHHYSIITRELVLGTISLGTDLWKNSAAYFDPELRVRILEQVIGILASLHDQGVTYWYATPSVPISRH